MTPTPREAAVAVVLRPVETSEGRDAHVLFVRRATFEGDPWSGHIALPGGRREPHDVSLEATARRETFEETGIDLGGAPCVAALRVVAPRTPALPPIVVLPFVFRYEGSDEVTLCDEVVEAFWLSLSSLRHPDAWHTAELVLRDRTRRVRAYPYGEHIIWGMTERVLAELVALENLDALIARDDGP